MECASAVSLRDSQHPFPPCVFYQNGTIYRYAFVYTSEVLSEEASKTEGLTAPEGRCMLKTPSCSLASARELTRGRSADQEAANIVIIIHAPSKLSRRSLAVRLRPPCRMVPFVSHDVGHANGTFVTVRRASAKITSAGTPRRLAPGQICDREPGSRWPLMYATARDGIPYRNGSYNRGRY